MDHGLKMEMYEPTAEPIYGDYLTMPSKPIYIYETGLNRALLYLIDNVVNCLDGKEELICTGEDAVKVHEVYEYLGV